MFEDLRRLRRSAGLRAMFAETHIRPEQLIYPIFVSEGLSEAEPIPSMPGQSHWPVDQLGEIADRAVEAGIGGVLVFGLPITKDEMASAAALENGVVPQALRALKHRQPGLVTATDVCVCSYTSHGHCGLLRGEELDHAGTGELLAKIAVSHAAAGADIVAPSSMVDGQVGAIRAGLDAAGFQETAIMGYSAKFASAFYGPFREAANSKPAFGDRRAYQHNPANARHALREMRADAEEGADILMVKPGLPYLDVVSQARAEFQHPLACYWVSGEYAMVKAAAANGWIDERAVVLESLLAFRRAGADVVITYHALDAAQWLA